MENGTTSSSLDLHVHHVHDHDHDLHRELVENNTTKSSLDLHVLDHSLDLLKNVTTSSSLDLNNHNLHYDLDHALHDHSQHVQETRQQDHTQAFLSPTTYSVLLWQSWTTTTLTGLLLGVLAGLLMSLLLEAVKLLGYTHKVMSVLSKSSSSIQLSLPQRLVATSLHLTEVTIGYLLMLLVMSFNIFIVMAVVVGAGLGHFVLRPTILRRLSNKLRGRQWVMRVTTPKPIVFQETNGLEEVGGGGGGGGGGVENRVALRGGGDGGGLWAQNVKLMEGMQRGSERKREGSEGNREGKGEGERLLREDNECLWVSSGEKVKEVVQPGRETVSREEGTDDDEACHLCDPDFQCLQVLVNGRETQL